MAARARLAFDKEHVLWADEVLQELTGLASGTRGQYIRAMWQYVIGNNLQLPGNGKMIVPNETFARIMGTPGQAIDGLTMCKYMKGHFLKAPAG